MPPVTPPTLVLGEASTLVMLGVSVALWIGARYLYPKKRSQASGFDTLKTALTTRGSRLSLQVGSDRVKDPIINWIGDREVRQESVGGGGGGKGGGGARGSDVQAVYYEGASVLLRIGPGFRLNRIIVSGEVLWTGPIDRFSTPSGSTITTSRGSFVIYWGEVDGPIDEVLASSDRIGIASCWPFMFRIRWVDFKLGSSPTWPDIHYEVDIEGGTPLSQSSLILQATDETYQDSGVNPAHIAFQLVTAPWPHGAGLTGVLDQASLESCGVLAEAEHTPARFVSGSGDTVADGLGRLMQDFGWMLVQEGGVLLLRPIREASYYPEFSDDDIVSPAPAISTSQGMQSVNRSVYLYEDRTLAYTQKEISFTDDADFEFRAVKEANVDMPSIIDKVTATKMAKRLFVLSTADVSQIEVTLGMTARSLIPGSTFRLASYGNLRVTSIRRQQDTGDILVNATGDSFATEDSGYLGLGSDGGSGLGIPVQDLAFSVYELPYSYVGDNIALGVVRIRGSRSSGASSIWASLDGSTYFTPGQQQAFAFGGPLRSGLSESTLPIVDEGPIFSALNSDVNSAIDLSGDVNGWLSGRQMALINDELFFVQKITPVGGSDYRLDGLIRACLGTLPGRHQVGSTVYIFSQNNVQPLSDPALTVGSTVLVKSVPAGIDINEVVSDSETIDGLARAPYPVRNLGSIYRMGGEYGSVVSAFGDTIRIAGDWSRKYKTGMWIQIAKDYGATHKEFYQISAVSYSAGYTDLTTTYTILHSHESGDRAYVANTGSSVFSQTLDTVLTWTFANRFMDGQAAGEQGYGVPISNRDPVAEGSFVLQVLSSGGGPIREVVINSSFPSFRYTQAMMTLDFGTTPDYIVFRVKNVLGAFSSAWSQVRLVKE